MPELPEVETIRRQLDGPLVGRVVTGTWAFPHPKFDAAHALLGATLGHVRRRGKYLIVDADIEGTGHELIVHLGMTGSLRVRPDGGTDPYDRARWELGGDGVLAFRDVRRFGRVMVTRTGEWPPSSTLANQGPEPWDPALDDETFWRSLRSSSRHVKTQLLSQKPVAGVGNIYADEALWLARIHPERRSLTRRQASALLAAVRTALEAGIEHGGTTLRDYVDASGGAGAHQHHLHCYGREGEPCERCGTALRRIVVDARSSTFCPTCQPPPRRRGQPAPGGA
jgi:formamidopyrimidine-DNA glycosylase